MKFHCVCGQPLNLREEPGVDIPHRRFMWVMFNVTCDGCWHARHSEPVPTCLRCNPPMELAA